MVYRIVLLECICHVYFVVASNGVHLLMCNQSQYKWCDSHGVIHLSRIIYIEVP